GRRGAFPTTVIFAKSKRKPRGFHGAGPQQARPPRASPQQAPAPRAGVPGSLRRRAPAPAGRRRVGSEAERGPEAAGSSPQGWRPEAASAGALGAETASERSAAGGGRAEAGTSPGEASASAWRHALGPWREQSSPPSTQTHPSKPGPSAQALRLRGSSRAAGRSPRPWDQAQHFTNQAPCSGSPLSAPFSPAPHLSELKTPLKPFLVCLSLHVLGPPLQSRKSGHGTRTQTHPPPPPKLSKTPEQAPLWGSQPVPPSQYLLRQLAGRHRETCPRSIPGGPGPGAFLVPPTLRPTLTHRKPCRTRTRWDRDTGAPKALCRAQPGRLPCSPPRSSGFLHQELPSEDLSAAARTAGSLLYPHLSPQEERPQEQTLNPRFQLCDSEHIPSPTGSPLLVKEGLGAATAQSSKHQRRTGPCTQPALVHWVLPREAGDTHLHGAGAAAGCWPQF
ncbi:LOW QUALITY PROTEIN: photoreceptor cilium actin regulator-like, partial [Camelus dromedarius]|uniref:LOW QUALITY PROTEIN: photoreceptor cilium actin regulator-like n=1 Tax=Camelus dromedarius TaxID=9838 RepID=UPI003119214C